MTTPSDPAGRPRVLPIVLARKGVGLADVLESIEAQVYETEDAVVVADHPLETPPGSPSPRRVRNISQAWASLETPVEYLWLLDARTTARPDALEALVSTALQVDASVTGSKVLDAGRPERLLSVGGATDVFGFPYTGLDHGELDQEQFDVIRDAAYLEPASVLVRRDLAEGLGGLDRKLPYAASGMDLCQRARVLGGRVVVAPASEVFSRVSGEHRLITWREQAGRLRVMFKTYSFVTLLWTVPCLFLLGLLMSVYRLARGGWLAPVDWIRTWAWNALHLPSTWNARRRKRTLSLAADAELFRYQVRGSVELRMAASELGALFGGGKDPEEDDPRLEASPAFWQRPSALAAALAAGFLFALVRSALLDGLPAVGYTLPLPESAWDALRAYAGGWHRGGLGSPEPMHPSVGATAAVKLLLGNNGWTASWLSAGAAVSGMGGMFVLVRRMGLGIWAGLAAGAVLLAGFPMLALTGEGYWPGLLAAGGFPWALAGLAAPAPAGGLGWIGRLARVGLATAWTAVFAPMLAAAPLIFGVVWGAAARSYRTLIIGSAASVMALPVLFPWLDWWVVRDPGGLVSGGVPFHLDPAWWAWAPAAAAGLAAVLFGRGRPMRAAAAGLMIGSAGFLAARSSGLGLGREATAAGILLTGLGVALAVAGAIDGPSTLEDARLSRRMTARIGAGAALLAALSTLAALPNGRMGLPDDRFGVLEFAETRAERRGPDRILMVGPGGGLPGEHRRLEDGTAYRLVGGRLDYSQAWLPQPRLGDQALEQTLAELIEGEELRPGGRLAEFGVEWTAATGWSPLVDALAYQLDMRPLSGLYIGETGAVWENEADAYRAVTDRGAPWRQTGAGYAGWSFGETVRISENADPRWGPQGWEQDGWANRVSTLPGEAVFGGVAPYRRLALASGAWAAALAGLAVGCRPYLRREQAA